MLSRFLALAALLLLTACAPPKTQEQPQSVDAGDYDTFWLWAGVKPQPVLDAAKTIYILQGQVEATDPVRMVSQRAATPNIHGRDVWIVFRIETLRWNPQIYEQLLAQVERWRAAGNRVVGVQIDFDARTQHLDEYAVFLRDFRQRLPQDYKLSVTGLLDWSAHGDPKGLNALSGVVDEVVLQIYQGRRVIPGYSNYLKDTDRLHMPFRIGLIQGGEWQAPPGLEARPNFRGYVVFLVNPQKIG